MFARPTCGTCPHFGLLEEASEAEFSLGECLANPPTPLLVLVPGESVPHAYSHRGTVTQHEPGCTHHPEMSAWVSAVKSIGAIEDPGSPTVHTWHGLNAGNVSVEARNEDEARTRAVAQLRTKVHCGTYTEADFDFDLLVLSAKTPVTEAC